VQQGPCMSPTLRCCLCQQILRDAGKELVHVLG